MTTESTNPHCLKISPAFATASAAIVCSANNHYAAYLGVMLRSLVDNAGRQNNYDIVVLHTDLSPSNQRKILSLTMAENISIRFLDVSTLTCQHRFFVNSYFSMETYFRLFIPQIFQAYEKILYLDADIIIQSDVAELCRMELGCHLIAATRNISTAVHAGRDNTIINGVVWKDYLRDTLMMGTGDVLGYFQAGVTLFNIARMLAEDTQTKLLTKAAADNHVLVDQDVLNSVCYGRVHFFTQQWNLHNNFNEEKNNLNYLDPLPANIREDYLAARRHPFIIHYAGPNKPWMSPSPEFHDIWWSFARRTPFYEEILYCNLPQYGFSALLKNKLNASEEVKNLRRAKIRCLKYWLKYKLSVGTARQKYKQRYRELQTQMQKSRALARCRL